MTVLAYFLRSALRNLVRFPLHNFIIFVCLAGSLAAFILSRLLVVYLESFNGSFPDSERIFTINTFQIDRPNPFVSGQALTPAALADFLRVQFPQVESVGAELSLPLAIEVTSNEFTASSRVRFVGPGYFAVFPLPLVNGTWSEARLAPDELLITESEALRRFGTTQVLGKRLRVAHRFELRVAGVLRDIDRPNHFSSLFSLMNADMIMPLELLESLSMASQQRGNTASWHDLSHITWIKLESREQLPGFSSQLQEFANEVYQEYPGRQLTFVPMALSEFAPSLLRTVLGPLDGRVVISTIAVLILALGALNAVNLSVAQLSKREREIAVHKVAGSSRLQMLLQFATEGLLMCTVALAAAVPVVLLLIKLLAVKGLNAELLLNLPLWGTVAVALLVLLAIVSSFPVWRLSRHCLADMMRLRGGALYSRRIQAVLVASQFTISTVFLAFMVIVIMQNRVTEQETAQFLAEPLVVLESVPASGQEISLFESELRRAPGIVAVARSSQTPFATANLPGALSRSRDPDAPYLVVGDNYVGHDYFQTMESPMLAGRDFAQDADVDEFPAPGNISSATGPYPLIIDEATARGLGWRDPSQAVGEYLYRPILPPIVRERMVVEHLIVGVVASPPLKLVNAGIGSSVYMLRPATANNLIVRLEEGAVQTGLASIAEVWGRQFPGASPNPQFLDQMFDQVHRIFLGLARIISMLALLACAIACIGMFGMASFVTNIRRREVGIRKVLGANRRRVQRMLLLDFMKPVLVASLIAWIPVSFLASAYLSLFIHRMDLGILPYGIALTVSLLLAALAVLGQTRKSAAVRPSAVLQCE